MDLEQDKSFAKEVGQADFRAEVIECDKPVLVVFWAPWSGACQTVKPMALELAARCAGRVKFMHANVDENPDLGIWYEIQFIPSILCFIGGEVRMQLHGTASVKAILEKLEPIINPAVTEKQQDKQSTGD